MIKFFTENKTGQAIKYSLAFFFIFFFILSIGFSNISTNKAYAQPSGQNTGRPGERQPAAEEFERSPQPEPEEPGWVERSIAGVFNSVIMILASVPMTLSSLLLWLSAELLEVIIKISMFSFREMVGQGSGVATTWKVFRDIANMFFIFILLYTAIATILGLGGIDIKKIITRVIIVALLINFSFFFTKVIIDSSNILAVGFYNEIVKVPCRNESVRNLDGRESKSNIGAAFMCKLGITSLFDAKVMEAIVTGKNGLDGSGKLIVFTITATIFILIATVIFFAAALMFLARLVTLIILLMLSPLAFAAMALPNDKYSKKWTDSLISNSIVAPVYMAATWAVLIVMDNMTIRTNSTLVDAILGVNGKPVGDAGTVYLNYFLLIGLMVSTLIISKQFGAYGAGGALTALNKARGWTQGQLGRGMVRGFGINKADKAFEESNFGQTGFGRGLRALTTGAATNYDFGSGKSVEKINKEIKKNQEDFLKNKTKELEKELEKELPKKRGELITLKEEELKTINNESTNLKTELAKSVEKRDNARNKINKRKEDAKNGNYVYMENFEDTDNQIKINFETKLIEELEEKLKKLENKKKSTEDLIETTTQNRDRDVVATKDEKDRWLSAKQKDLAKTLQSDGAKSWIPTVKRDYGKVAEELIKLARGGGGNELENAIKKITGESGGGPPKTVTKQ